MKKNILFLLLTIAIGSQIISKKFSPVLQNPNSYIYSNGGDAIKSYYNFSYYIKHDRGIKHDGINYPYGDHLSYINSHPLYSQIIKFIDKYIVSISDYGVAILNLSMLFAIILALPFIFLILRYYNLPPWYACIISIFIIFQSPQLDRIHGHFEMVYLFFIPAFWYLFLRWNKAEYKKWMWASLLIITGLIGAFTSAYFAALYSVFFLAYWLITTLKNIRHLKKHKKELISLFVIAIVPVFALKTFVSTTDWVIDRPYNPWGFYLFHSNLSSIFLPKDTQFQAFFKDYINMSYQWEGRAYVGFPGTLLFITFLGSIIYSILPKTTFNWKIYFSNKSLNRYLVAAIVVLIFSMCIPFRFGWDFILDIFPPIRQFRALGRFSWIFYFVFTVFTACFYYKNYRLLRLKKLHFLSIILLLFILSLWASDTYQNVNRMANNTQHKNNVLEANHSPYEEIFSKHQIDTVNYQAILALPFTNTCGDKLLFEDNIKGFIAAMNWSYHSGIPIIESFSPRLSFTHALSSIQLLADSTIAKSRLADMNEKDILLIYHKSGLKEVEKQLIKKAKLLWENENTVLAQLPITAFTAPHQSYHNKIANLLPSLSFHHGVATKGAYTSYLYNSFDTQDSYKNFLDKSNLHQEKGTIELFNRTFSPNSFGHKAEVSFWVYVDDRIDNMPEAHLFIHHTNSDEKPTKVRLNHRQTHNIYKKWARYELTFPIESNKRYELQLQGKLTTVDELLVRPHQTMVLIKKDMNTLLINNFPFKTEK